MLSLAMRWAAVGRALRGEERADPPPPTVEFSFVSIRHLQTLHPTGQRSPVVASRISVGAKLLKSLSLD